MRHHLADAHRANLVMVMNGMVAVTGLVELTAGGGAALAALLADGADNVFFCSEVTARAVGIPELVAVGLAYGLVPGRGILLSARDDG